MRIVLHRAAVIMSANHIGGFRILSHLKFCIEATVIVLVVTVNLLSSADVDSAGMKEYCERDVFRADCPSPDEVVLITHARYGRMRDGRCITNTYGGIGCSTDVRPLLESACSAQRRCETTVATLVPDHAQPCPSDFRSYLEASYECIKVLSINNGRHCVPTSGTTVAQITSDMSYGYLSSVVAEETQCATVDSPLKLVAPPGRRLRLYLLDFTSQQQQKQREQRPGTCQVYAVLREDSSAPGNSQTVCGEASPTGERKETLIFSSVTGSVEVRLVVSAPRHKSPTSSSQVPPARFLVKFEVFGCADPPKPTNGGMQRTDNDVVMWCNNSMLSSQREPWYLKCDGNKWVGPSRDCTSEPALTNSETFTFGFDMLSNLQGVSILIVLIIALTIGITIAALGAVYLRSRMRQRRESSYQQQQHAVSSAEQYDYTTYRLQGTLDTKRAGQPELQQQFGMSSSLAATAAAPGLYPYERDSFNSSENDYYKAWQTQRRMTQPPNESSSAIGCSGEHVVDHIYESPNFARKNYFKTFSKS